MAWFWQKESEFDDYWENEIPYMDSDGTWKYGTKGDSVFEAGKSLSDKAKILADKMYQTEDSIKSKVLNFGNNAMLLGTAAACIFCYFYARSKKWI